MSNWADKGEHYFFGRIDELESIKLNGWTASRDKFNLDYPNSGAWKPATAQEWQYCKGRLSSLLDTIKQYNPNACIA
jgi:hypothetical protein